MKLKASLEVRSDHIVAKVAAIRQATGSAARLAAQATLAEAQRRVKKGKTRKLHDSLRISGAEGGIEFRAGSDEPYALFQEHGTKRTHAAPFLSPGAAVGRLVLKAEAESKIRDAAR